MGVFDVRLGDSMKLILFGGLAGIGAAAFILNDAKVRGVISNAAAVVSNAVGGGGRGFFNPRDVLGSTFTTTPLNQGDINLEQRWVDIPIDKSKVAFNINVGADAYGLADTKLVNTLPAMDFTGNTQSMTIPGATNPEFFVRVDPL